MRHPASPLQERRKSAGTSLSVSQRGKTVSPVVTSGCPKRSEGGFPVGTRANTVSRAEPRTRNQKRNGLAPEELDRTRRNRCTVRNSNDDGGGNTHVHVTARIRGHTCPGAFARAEAARLHGDG